MLPIPFHLESNKTYCEELPESASFNYMCSGSGMFSYVIWVFVYNIVYMPFRTHSLNTCNCLYSTYDAWNRFIIERLEWTRIIGNLFQQTA